MHARNNNSQAAHPSIVRCRYDGLLAKVFGGKKKATSSSGNKPWLQW